MLNGYPLHYWFVLGELSLAEESISLDFPAVAGKLREHRKQLESHPKYALPYLELLEEVSVVGGCDVRDAMILEGRKDGTTD